MNAWPLVGQAWRAAGKTALDGESAGRSRKWGLLRRLQTGSLVCDPECHLLTVKLHLLLVGVPQVPRCLMYIESTLSGWIEETETLRFRSQRYKQTKDPASVKTPPHLTQHLWSQGTCRTGFIFHLFAAILKVRPKVRAWDAHWPRGGTSDSQGH